MFKTYNTIGELLDEMSKVSKDPKTSSSLKGTQSQKTEKTYPVFDYYQTADKMHVLEFAVAGYSKESIDVNVEDENLVVSGAKQELPEDRYYHKRHISRKAFELKLPILVEIEEIEAQIENGILTVTMKEKPKKETKVKINFKD